MFSELMRKWFGLPTPVCLMCEVLRDQLDKSDEERRDLLRRLLEKDKPEPPSTVQEPHIPITPQFVPWRVRQQMLEQEDRRAAQLMKDRKDDIEKLEQELGVKEN